MTGAALFALAGPAQADTLQDALLKAYQGNPTLTAARAEQRANDENVPIARSAGLPNLSVSGGYAENVLGPKGQLAAPPRNITGQLTGTLPIISFGAVRNSVRAAETRVDSGQASLRGTESQLFTDVVGAYMDVIRDDAIVGLNQQNVHVLEVNLDATRDRFQVGDLTRTDVAQSEARLAVARGQLQSAQANLISSRESYIRLVGVPPGTLEEPPALPKLPDSPDSAVDTAVRDNPSLLAAQRNSDATTYDIRVAKAGRLPRIGLTAGGNYVNYLGSLGNDTNVSLQGQSQSATTGSVGVSLSVPLFQGGRPAAEVRQAQAQRSQALEQVTETERLIVAQTRSAYAIWKSSLEVIASSEVAVKANKLSLEGVRAENSVGNRTILDILNTEQDLLNSQVTLVTAQRDAYVAGFALLAAMGHAEARDLGLSGGVLYNPVTNYDRVRHRFSDFADDKSPTPQAKGTADTPAQGAQVTRPLDPILDAPVDTTRPNPPGNAPK